MVPPGAVRLPEASALLGAIVLEMQQRWGAVVCLGASQYISSLRTARRCIHKVVRGIIISEQMVFALGEVSEGMHGCKD